MDNKHKILVVEDDKGISSYIHTILTSNGYAVLRAADGADAMMMVTSHCPDLMLLDLGLPDMDGMQIIRCVREWSHIPILVVSARTHEQDKVDALDAGADDYICKPFGSAELLARIRTSLRHVATSGDSLFPQHADGPFRAGALTVDHTKRQVLLDGEPVHLTHNEHKIVALLARYAGRVLTYDHILKAIWGPNAGGDTQGLRVHMANIRRKLEQNPADPQYIFTETGVGYRMIEGD